MFAGRGWCGCSLLVLMCGCGDDGQGGPGGGTTTATEPVPSTSGPTTAGPTTAETTTAGPTGATTSTSAGTTADTDDTPTTGEPPSASWVVSMRGLDVTSLVRDPGGDLIVAGHRVGIFRSFGGVDLEDQMHGYGIFLLRVGPDGDLLWHRSFDTSSYPDGAYDLVAGAAVGPGGEVVLTGMHAVPVDLGGGPIDSAGDNDLFLAKFGPDGAHQWSRALTGPGIQYGRAVAVDAAGDIFLGGAFAGQLSVGADDLVSQGDTDILLARYTPAGDPVWARGFGSGLDDTALQLAVDGAGDVLLLASLYDDGDLGGGPISEIECCRWNAVVAKFATDGTPLWGTAVGSTTNTAAWNALAVCPSDELVAVASEGLVALSKDGAVKWRDADDGPNFNDAACRVDDELLAAGYLFYKDMTDVGDGPLGPFAANPSLVARYDAQGGLLAKSLFSLTFEFGGDPAASKATAIQVGPGGEVTFVIDGSEQILDLGDGPIAGDGFMIRRHE